MIVRMVTIVLFIGASLIASENSPPGTGAPEGMVLIPAGTFDMGSVHGENDEKPVHRVSINSFYMGETEVTIWEYLQCVQAVGC